MPEGQPKPDADRECARQDTGGEGVREVAFGPEHGAPVGEPLPDPTTDCELGFGTRTGAELEDVQPHPRRHVRCAHQPVRSAPPPQQVQHVHAGAERDGPRSEEHTSELQSPCNLVCRLLLEKKTVALPPRSTLACFRPPTSLLSSTALSAFCSTICCTPTSAVTRTAR